MNPILAKKNSLLHTPEKPDEARIVRTVIAEAAYCPSIRCREDGLKARIILLRVVVLALMMRVSARENICIRFGWPIAIASAVGGDRSNKH
jgi:hypothetical protein